MVQISPKYLISARMTVIVVIPLISRTTCRNTVIGYILVPFATWLIPTLTVKTELEVYDELFISCAMGGYRFTEHGLSLLKLGVVLRWNQLTNVVGEGGIFLTPLYVNLSFSLIAVTSPCKCNRR